MKTIGMIGGLSWESSAEYYRIINQEMMARSGGQHNAKSLMITVDHSEIFALQRAGDWDTAHQHMVRAATSLERGGADCILICANTMHKSVPAMEIAVNIPVIHIADVTGEAVRHSGLRRVGFLGTRYSMEGDFITGRLAEKFSLEVLIPDEPQRTIVHDVIYGELTNGIIRDESRKAYQAIIESLVARGAEGIILGCTEIPLLIQQEHSPVPVFDTTRLHALAGVDFALGVTEAHAQ